MKKMLGALLASSLLLTGCASAGQKPPDRDADYTAPSITARVFIESAARETRQGAVGTAGTEQVSAAEAGLAPFAIEETEPPLQDRPEQGTGLSVSFRPETRTRSREDGSALFISQIQHPAFCADDRQTTLWLEKQMEGIGETMQQKAAEILAQASTDYEQRTDGLFYTYSYYSDLRVARMDRKAVSLLQMNSTYSGGAHPNNLQQTYTFDLETHRQLTLQDVLLPAAADKVLEGLLDKLEQQIGSVAVQGLFPEYRRLVTKQFSGGATDNWYFSREGLTFFFNSYDIAPYAAGVIDICFRYEELGDILQPAYFPEPVQTRGQDGELVCLTEPGNRTVLVSGDPAQEAVYLTGRGEIRDLRVYSVSGWVSENAPIISSMTFAADRLGDGQALQISVAEQQEYLLIYHTNAGKKCACLLSDDGLKKMDDLIIK